jgi:hypothetical protein
MNADEKYSRKYFAIFNPSKKFKLAQILSHIAPPETRSER